MTLREPRAESPYGRLAVGVGVDDDQDPRSAVRRALSVAYATLPAPAELVILFATTGYDLATLLGAARVFTGPVPLIGGTSGSGLMTSAGVADAGPRGRAVAAMALAGAGLVAGVGHSTIGGDARASGEAAAQAALASALTPNGPARACILLSPPGHEEEVLTGVTGVVGRGVPIFGGSVADQQMLSHWSVFAGNHLLPNGVAVALLYGNLRAGSAFSGGYWPTARSARAEHVSGGRMVELLNGQPAAGVYASWIGVTPEALRGPAVRRYAASPLAVEDQRSSRLLVKEPGTVATDGRIGFFADVKEGEELRLLTSTPESLVAAAGAAVAEAMMRADLNPGDVSCVLLAHGAGRAQALEGHLEEVPVQVRRLVGAAPLLGCSTFGEQSLLADGRPVHLNLTATALVLGG
jgi:hypothetical protein